MSEPESLSGRGRSQQLGRMGEYAVMAQLLSKSWVVNVYSPAADSGVDIVLLTKTSEIRKLQVKTSRIYPSQGAWFNNLSKRHLQADGADSDMFYVLAEGHPPIDYLIFPAKELLEHCRIQFVGTCQGRLVRFEEGFPAGKKYQLRHYGPDQRREATIEARISSRSINKYWNNWDLLK